MDIAITCQYKAAGLDVCLMIRAEILVEKHVFLQ